MTAYIDIDEVIACMWQALVDEPTSEGALARLVVAARDALPGAVDAGLMVPDGGQPRTPACTSERVADVDLVQYQTDTGPCLEAWRSGRRTELASTAADERWARFSEACRARGIGSVLSVPLVAAGQPLGSLTFYGAGQRAFGAQAHDMASEMGVQVAMLLDSAVAYWTARARTQQLDDETLNGSIGLAVTGRGGWRVALQGEFDEPESAHLRVVLLELVERSHHPIDLDMSRVEFMGSAGLAAVLDAWEAATLGGLRMVISNPSPMVRRLLDVVGLQDLIGETAS